MNLVPEEELAGKSGFNLAPMVDFLSCDSGLCPPLQVTRAALFDSEVSLVKITDNSEAKKTFADSDLSIVNLAVTASGEYKWITEFNEYLMENTEAIEQELSKQEHMGLLPRDHTKIKVLLHIDKRASRMPIAQIIFTLKRTGFHVSPVYEVDEAV
jgi:hypothetical protein